MKKDDELEKFILHNRSDFDVHEPADTVWQNISHELRKPSLNLSVSKNWWWIAAAGVLLFIIPTVYMMQYKNFYKNGGSVVSAENRDASLIIEAEMYYTEQISDKLIQFKKCSVDHPELINAVENDLSELEIVYQHLKSDLKENIDNQEVVEAMIDNNRERLFLLEDVLKKIDC